MIELTKYVNELPGYKISNTHFRLGSKIHISQFFYAKRLFQNSFFASRLAFLISKEILKDHKANMSEITHEGLTLIGYGLYSELLISLVEKFLKKYLSLTKINHDLISDAEEPSFIKDYDDTYKNIIIIVPIASTFSTAIKIKDFLTYTLTDKYILEPYLNILHVSHSPSNIDEKPDANNIFPIEKNFGWTKKVGKTIWIKEMSTAAEKSQKYLLTLKSEWNNIKDCKLCFPKEKYFLDERPLFFTDKSSVTPTLIFGKPKARKIEENKVRFLLKPETLLCGHFIRGSNHFRYYIRIEKFYIENIISIERWLDELKFSNSFKSCFNETSRVIIIAPNHYSNAGFINFVNEKLFSNAANIIHYDPQNDHILNFNLLYGKELNEEGTKLVFIDDTITTGSTFRKINFFIENTHNNSKKFDACIVLLDRSNRNVHKQFKSRANLYYSFANLHLPSLKDFDGECPLDIGYQKYHKLVESSFLTRMKTHFLYQKDKLEERNINKSSIKTKKNNHCDDQSYIRQVEGIHRVYEWSRKSFNVFDTSFEIWKESLINNTKSPFVSEALYSNTNDENGLSNETATLIKILSHSPFVHYKPIKDNLFKWVLTLLEIKIKQINKEVDNNNLTYQSFRDLKFLIRRAGLLNTNFLISYRFMKFLSKLYGNQGLALLNKQIIERISGIEVSPERTNLSTQTLFDKPQERPEQEKKRLIYEMENIENFHVFYTAQLKELLFMNEARSIHIEKTLNKIKNTEVITGSYKQLLRFVQEENGILIINFWSFIRKHLISFSNYTPLTNEQIKDVLRNHSVKDHYRTKLLKEFLSLPSENEQELHDNIPFVNFIKLMHFFEIEKNIEEEGSISKLSAKTNFIIDQFRDIICNSNDEENNIHGAFFLIKYKKNTYPFLAYNHGSCGIIDKTYINQDNYINDFLQHKDEDKTNKTIIEFHKQNGKWYDLYATTEENKELKNDFRFLPDDYNRLLLVRFSKLIVDNSNNKRFEDRLLKEVQGIVGFYFNKQDELLTDIFRTRYLLLLCSSMCSFIEIHHQSDEFRDWIEADNIRKLALLSGHGREMLLKIAAKEESSISYKDIVLNLEHLQMIITLDNNVTEITGHTKIKERFNKFYNVKGSLEINNLHILRIAEMAKQIYDFKEIENEVQCKIIGCAKNDLKFAFHKALLDMMCFEILLNAKKNRWHFLNDENISINTNKDSFIDTDNNDGVFEYQAGQDTYNSNLNNGLKQNILEITALVKNSQLVLSISNTGPKVGDDIITLLNKGLSPKRDSNIAGIQLLQALLSPDGFGLGKIKFGELPLNEALGLCKFTITLTLNSMNDE